MKKLMKNPIMKKILTVIMYVLFISCFIFLFIRLNPYLFRFPERFESKEGVKEFVVEHEEELNDVAKNLIDIYRKSNESSIFINSSYDSRGFDDGVPDDIRSLFKKYDIIRFGADGSEKDDSCFTCLEFGHEPKETKKIGSFYWSVFYSESGDVLFPYMSDGSKLLKKDGKTYFYEVPGQYIDRIEHITGNWYYWETQWYKFGPIG